MAQASQLKILITGAAGNLGGLTARHVLAQTNHHLHLLVHHTGLGHNLQSNARVQAFNGDLGNKTSLYTCLRGVDVVIHYAGVLFRANPQKFLPRTNTAYFKNLCDAAADSGVRRMMLISFPHVEGETTKDHPATGRLDGQPDSVHARTRLAEEQYLFDRAAEKSFEPVCLRVGMVYGKGILMMDAARWLARRRLLAVWRKPTWIHLISRDDFLRAVLRAATADNIHGIYHLGDQGHQTLQTFLDIAADTWGYPRPKRLPLPLIHAAASLCEMQSGLLGTPSPLTRDFITIGTQSYYGDTTRMHADLIRQLIYPTIYQGKAIL